MVTNDNNFVIFKVNDLFCALSCLDVQEIIRDLSKITNIAQAPPYIDGVINLRGKIVTVINLPHYFELEYKKADKDSIIIVDEEDEQIGLLVSEVIDVIDVSHIEIENTPAVPHKLNPLYVKSVMQMEKEIVAILNVHEILKVDLIESE